MYISIIVFKIDSTLNTDIKINHTKRSKNINMLLFRYYICFGYCCPKEIN